VGKKRPNERRTRINPRNNARREKQFARNFGSEEFVYFTDVLSACLFCARRDATIRTAHLLQARGMGGCGGDVSDAGPVCHGCDTDWARGEESFLASRGLTWEDVERRIRAHHNRFLRWKEGNDGNWRSSHPQESP
jgi:hypothetical protein